MSSFFAFVSLLITILVLLVLSVFAFFTLYQLCYFRTAPYVPSKKDVMTRMIELAEIREGARVLELGSGNGELCIRAAERGARALGIEVNPFLVAWSRLRARRRQMSARATFLRQDFWKSPFPAETTVVFLYLLPETMKTLWPKLRAELRPGTVLVSNAFDFPEAIPEIREGAVIKYRLS